MLQVSDTAEGKYEGGHDEDVVAQPSSPDIAQFISKYNLDDIGGELISSRLQLTHLQGLNTEDMSRFNSLCDDWKLNTAQRIRLEDAIKSLPPVRSRANLKIAVLGEGRVGKTSMIRAMTGNTFDTNIQSTIQASYKVLDHAVEHSAVQYAIWDTAGQERFHALAPIYRSGARYK